MSTPTPPTLTIDSLLRVIEVRDSEVALLKLMVDKLKLQLLCRVRSEFGTSSEQLDAQISLIDVGATPAPLAVATPAKSAAANAPEIDRSLPAHLPRGVQVHRPKAVAAHHDTAGQACGCIACGGRLRQIGQDVSEQLKYVPFALQSHPPCTAQAGLRGLPIHLPGHGAKSPYSAWCRQTWSARSCDGLQVLRPHSPISAERHLRLRWRRDRPLHDGRLGRSRRSVARPVGGCAWTLHAGRI